MSESSNPTFSGPYDHEFDPSYADLDETLFDAYAPLASPWARLGAVILNALVLFGTMLPGLILIGIGEENGSDALAGLGGIILAGSILALCVYQTVILSRDGQSIGKKVLQLRIVDAYDESNPGFARVILLRFFVMQLLGIIPFVSLIDAVMVFTEEHKTIHDRIASTLVVSERGL